MHDKTVLVVEDEVSQRNPLQQMLCSRGFRAEGASNVTEAFRAIDNLGQNIDVMVLDMRLDDPDYPGMTGADIGIRVQDQHPDWRPEFLISTVHSDEVNYYKTAVRLGAAAYLSKRETKITDVVRHVRALALKRSLRAGHPPVIDALGSAYLSTRNLSEALEIFCRRLLAKQLDACLGAPYLLLLTDPRGTQSVANRYNLPTGSELLYSTLQNMAQGISNRSAPYTLTQNDLDHLPQAANNSESKVLERLLGAALISLSVVRDYRLSLILLDPQQGETEYPEDTAQLASVVAQYVRPTIVEHFLGILTHLEAQKKAMLKSISYFCLYLGQDQQAILDDAISSGDLQEGTNGHEKLATMAEDLWQTGTMLNSAANGSGDYVALQFEMAPLLKRVFDEMKKTLRWRELRLSIEGSCRVSASLSDMTIALRRLLQWFAERRSETPRHLSAQIKVQCYERDETSVIVFEDCSRKLPAKVREYLFEPFSTSTLNPTATRGTGPGLYLPLYLAKVLVEEICGGSLVDSSDDIEGNIGHRLVMQLRWTRTRSQDTISLIRI